MTFNNLHADTHCNCLSDCTEDSVSMYAIKANKAITREVDFKSKYEKAAEKGEELTLNSCEEICCFKGLSCSKMTAETKTEVLHIYNELFKSSPKYKPYMHVLKVKESSGVFKFTPNDSNKYHHDFYKADTFTMQDVEILESISISENV